LAGLRRGRYVVRAEAPTARTGEVVARLPGNEQVWVEVRLDPGGRPAASPGGIEELPGDGQPETPIPEEPTGGGSGIYEMPAEGEPPEIPIPEETDEPPRRPANAGGRPAPSLGRIRFVYSGRRYVVGGEAYPDSLILLPDRSLLEVRSWLESDPPQPVGLRELGFVVEAFVEDGIEELPGEGGSPESLIPEEPTREQKFQGRPGTVRITRRN
jgi:hypothetical protein